MTFTPAIAIQIEAGDVFKTSLYTYTALENPVHLQIEIRKGIVDHRVELAVINHKGEVYRKNMWSCDQIEILR